jgi:hypothetical protein
MISFGNIRAPRLCIIDDLQLIRRHRRFCELKAQI